MSRIYFRTFMNSLKLPEWEPAFRAPNLPEDPTPERLLEFLCALDTPSSMSAFKKRYIQISEKDRDLLLALEEPDLKENLFGPLRQAKTNYVIGNYVGSIALCGIVAEKVAILIHMISSANETELGRFQGLPQFRRVRELKLAGHIDEQSVHDFGEIRAARKSYLHHWNTPEEQTAKRAAKAYASAMRLVLGVMKLKIVNGHVSLNPKLTRYLEVRGDLVVKEDDE